MVVGLEEADMRASKAIVMDSTSEGGRQDVATKRKLNWRSRGVSRFESLWSILHKFAWLNRASPLDIRLTFGGDSVRRSPCPGNLKCDLRWFGHLDPDRLASLLELPREILEFSVAAAYELPTVAPTFNDAAAGALRFCPVCIRSGYHSSLFQLQYVARCPLHDKALAERCPRCGEALPYLLPPTPEINPYGCVCGHVLWPKRQRRSWAAPLAPAEERIMKRFADWQRALARAPALAYAVHSLHVWRWAADGEGSFWEKWPGYFRDIVPMRGWPAAALVRNTDEVHVSVPCGFVPASTCLKSISRDFWRRSDIKYEDIHSFGASLYPIYKSVRRKFGRMVRRNHSSCVKNLPQSEGDPKKRVIGLYCPWASTFRSWRERWEQAECTNNRQHYYDWVAIVRVHTEFLREILSAAGKQDLRKPQRERQLTLTWWIGRRLFGLYLLADFFAILQARLEGRKGSRTLLGGTFGTDNMPYVLYVPALNNSPHALHWWTLPMMAWMEKRCRATVVHRAQAKATASAIMAAERAYFRRLERRRCTCHDDVLDFEQFVRERVGANGETEKGKCRRHAPRSMRR